MMPRVRFGPAGKPPRFKGPMPELPAFLASEGLDLLEYQAVRGVRIKEPLARQLGEEARKHDVLLTLHGPYFINLSSPEEEKVEKSIERIVRSAQAASWMGAVRVVFHPGYYGKLSPSEALKRCIKAMEEAVERIRSLGIKGVYLGPETTGKVKQVGSLEEIIAMCESVDDTLPTVDWAHIHARGMGCIRGKDDYLRLLDQIEGRLGSKVVENLHCHFTLVEFGKGGEKKHHTLDEKGYGPPFEPLAEIIAEQGYSWTIVSESPVLDVDAIKMKEILLKKAGR